jgi:hypothetical protein
MVVNREATGRWDSIARIQSNYNIIRTEKHEILVRSDSDVHKQAVATKTRLKP